VNGQDPGVEGAGEGEGEGEGEGGGRDGGGGSVEAGSLDLRGCLLILVNRAKKREITYTPWEHFQNSRMLVQRIFESVAFQVRKFTPKRRRK
jgi:hypothetical protein